MTSNGYLIYIFFLVWLTYCPIVNSRKKINQDKATTPLVIKEFLVHIKELIRSLPLKRQCSMIQTIASDSNSTVARIEDVLFTKDLMRKLPSCEFNTSWTILASNNVSVITGAYKRQSIHIFNTIPEPFQCYIVHAITMKVRAKQNRTVHVKRVENDLLRHFGPHLQIGRRCSRVSHQKRDELLSSGLVDAIIERSSMKKQKKWIEKFKSAVSKIYFRSFTKTRKATKKKPQNASRDPLIPVRESNIYTLPILARSDFDVRIRKVSREDKYIRINFYMLVKGDVFSTIVKSTEIIHTFNNHKSRKQFSNLLQAKKVDFSLPQSSRKSRNKKGKLYTSEISAIKSLLPKYLFKYYRTFDNSDHCFILVHIAVKLEKKLDHVERLLTTLNYLPRELLCSIPNENVNSQDNFEIPQTKFAWEKKKLNGRDANNTDNIDYSYEKIYEEVDAPIREEMSTLEIVLFVLLALLSLAVLAFLANCLIFSVKGNKSKEDYNINNQNVLADTVLGERLTTETNEIGNLESEVGIETEQCKDVIHSPV